jgi:hypothetical protein
LAVTGLVPVVAPLIVTVPMVLVVPGAAAKIGCVSVIVIAPRVTAQLAVLLPALLAVIVVVAAEGLPNVNPAPDHE